MASSIEAANFLSWKTLKFPVTSGVTLIDGWNDDDQTSEGSGKSAVLNALSWCLYGKIPKDANIDDVIKTGEKGCGVVVRIDETTSVVRSRRPNDLYILQDNKKIKGKDARETQKMIEELVGLSFDAFCQTKYFAQNYDKKFVTANQEDKGKILSEVQDLQVFDKARKETMSLIKASEKALVNLDHQLTVLQKDLELVDKDIENEKNLEAQRIQQKERRILEADVLIQKLQGQVDGLLKTYNESKDKREAFAAKLSPINEEFIKATDNLRTRKATVEAALRDIDTLRKSHEHKKSMGQSYAQRYQVLEQQKTEALKFIENPTKDCPTCGTTLKNVDTTRTQQQLEATKKEMEDIMNSLSEISEELKQTPSDPMLLQNELAEISSELHGRETEMVEAQSINNEYSRLEAYMTAAETQVNTVGQDLERAKNNLVLIKNETVEVDVARMQSLLKSKVEIIEKKDAVSKTLAEKKTYLNRLETLKSGFKEVKSHVFNSLLNEINARANQYAAKLFEVPVSIQFKNDNMKIQTHITLNGDPRGLGLLSGGQFRRVSLAVDLALSDIISARKNAKLNLLILDEYFKDLSESSMEKCLELLQQRNQPVILIEHNSIFKNIIDNTFFVNLTKGTSHVKV